MSPVLICLKMAIKTTNKHLTSINGWTGVTLKKFIEFIFEVSPDSYEFSKIDHKYIFIIPADTFESKSGYYEKMKDKFENELPLIFKTY